jgi:hypothetical protein
MATASKHRTTGRLPRQAARQRRDKEKETQIRTAEFNGYGFLKTGFLPVTDTIHEELKCTGKIEREFFNSLSNLVALYGFQPLDVKGKVFPYSILLAYRHAVEQVKKSNPALQLLIIQDKEHAACLATVKQMDTGATLYYVPVRPLYELLQDRSNKKLAELLLSVYTYLYQVAGIPYYRDSSSYMYYTYEMMEEWIRDNPTDWDEEDFTAQVSCLNSLSYYGDRIKRKIRNPYNLQQFEKRVSQYVPKTIDEERLHELSRKFISLYQQFPNRSIMDNIHDRIIEPQKDERIYPDQYISFYWDYKDCLYQSLFETVNMELQEKEVTEEPLSIQLFDKPQEKIQTHEMEFEIRFFDLLHELNDLL